MPDMALAPGSVFAGFTIEREIGAGGMGEVYLARHPRLPRHVALKLLRTDLGADPSFVSRFQREAETVAGLDHPNIVPIDDSGAENGQLWLSMRFINGTTADKALAAYRPAAMPPRRAVHIVEKVASALDFAHRRNLVHRDVKPANILLAAGLDDEPEQVFLSDFGVAKAFGEIEAHETALTAAGGVVATIDYAAPEQIEGRPLDGRCDIYALGCVLYKLLTGSVPFPGETLAAKVYARMHNPPPAPSVVVPGLPAAFDAVIATAMAREPQDRFATCRDLALAARRALGEQTMVPEQATQRVDASDMEATQLVTQRSGARTMIAAELPPGPGTDPPSSPGTTGSQLPAGLAGLMAPGGPAQQQATDRSAIRRRSIYAIAGVVLLAAAVGVFAFVRAGKVSGTAAPAGGSATSSAATTASTDSSTVPSTSTSTETSTSESSTSASATTGPAALPHSAPLDDSTLVVARQVGNTYGLYTFDVADNEHAGPLVPTDVGGMNPVLSKDRGSIIYVALESGGGSALRTVAVDGSGNRQLFPLPKGCTSVQRPAWNATDQNLLAINCATAAGRTAVMIVDLTGAVQQTLDTGLLKVDDLSFSPDGTKLTYWGSNIAKAGDGALYVQDVSGGAPRKLVDERASDPIFSPDGTKIAYRQGSATGGQIDVIGVDGGAPVAVTAKDANDLGPSWSPDGSKIAFKSTRDQSDKRIGLWVVDADGQNPYQLEFDDDGSVFGSPAWGNR